MIRSLAATALVCAVSAATACAQPTAAPSPTASPFDGGPYPWLGGTTANAGLTRLEQRFPTPRGTERAPVDDFGAWLRGLPVHTDRTTVRAFNGRHVVAPAAAVIALDVGARDLQQCADTIIRLRAEFLWARGAADTAAFHFTSGDLSTWPAWVAGERWTPRGVGVVSRSGPERPADHTSYRNWLDQIFTYAGTLSLRRDSAPVEGDLLPGDFFVDPGSPGHAVIILDVAVAADGNRFALIGQGYTPAQELHVLMSSTARDDVWFALPATPDDFLDVPSWSPFPRSSARRFTR